MTTVKELIEKLQEYDQDLPVIIDDALHADMNDLDGFHASDFFPETKIEPITLYLSEAQSNRESLNDLLDEDYIEYSFDEYQDSPEEPLIDKKTCLVISSPAFDR